MRQPLVYAVGIPLTVCASVGANYLLFMDFLEGQATFSQLWPGLGIEVVGILVALAIWRPGQAVRHARPLRAAALAVNLCAVAGGSILTFAMEGAWRSGFMTGPDFVIAMAVVGALFSTLALWVCGTVLGAVVSHTKARSNGRDADESVAASL